jgi:hypothetical protein
LWDGGLSVRVLTWPLMTPERTGEDERQLRSLPRRALHDSMSGASIVPLARARRSGSPRAAIAVLACVAIASGALAVHALLADARLPARTPVIAAAAASAAARTAPETHASADEPLPAAELEAALRMRDDAIPSAIGLARAGRSSRSITEALARAGTDASQAALCALASDSGLAPEVRAEATTSLVLVKKPTAATLQAVGVLARGREPSSRRPALFVAGALARAARPQHPAEAAEIERIVLAASAGARTIDDRLDALAALGNLGSASILPRVRPELAAPEPKLRAAAARALRFVPDPEADRILLAVLAHETDPTVRAAAIFAAGFRRIGPLADGLAIAAETDPVEFVRADAVTLLARHVRASARAARALDYVAHNDASAEVRRLALRGDEQRP